MLTYFAPMKPSSQWRRCTYPSPPIVSSCLFVIPPPLHSHGASTGISFLRLPYKMLVTGWFATTEIHSFTVLEDKSVMQVSAGLVPSVASEGGVCSVPLSYPLLVTGNPWCSWFVDVAFQSLLSLSHSLVRTTATGFNAHPSPIWPHFNLIIPQRPYFQMRSHSEILGVYEFWKKDITQYSTFSFSS